MHKPKAIGVSLGADSFSAWVADSSVASSGPAAETSWPNPEFTDEHRAALPAAVLNAWRLRRACEVAGADAARDIFAIMLPPGVTQSERRQWDEAAAIVGMKHVVFWSAAALAAVVALQLKAASDQGASVTLRAPTGDEGRRRAWQSLLREHDDLDLLAAAASDIDSVSVTDDATSDTEWETEPADSAVAAAVDEAFAGGVESSDAWGMRPGESPMGDLGIEKPIYSRQRSGMSGMKMAIINAIGFSVCSILGLVLGYYILVWLRPDKNFLDLNLPGLHDRADDVQASGEWDW